MPTPANASDAYKKQIATIGGVINVLHYGADNSGATDCTDEVHAAFAAVPSTGGTVYFPSGTYLTDGLTYDGSAPLRIVGDSQSLLGDSINIGSVLKLSTASNTILTLGGTYNRSVDVENIMLFGNSLAGAVGIASYRWQCTLRNVHANMFEGSGSIAFNFPGSVSLSTTTNTLDNCRARKAATAIKTDRTTALNVIGGYYDGSDGAGSPGASSIGVDSSSTNGDTINCIGVNFDSFATAVSLNHAGDRIIGCRFEGNANAITIGASASNTSVIGNYMLGNGSGTAVTITSGASNAQLLGNTYSNWSTRISNSGTNSLILDLLPMQYDFSTDVLTTSADVTIGGNTKANKILSLDYNSTLNLTASQNDYAGNANSFWLLNPDGDYTITGISGGIEGRILIITNVVNTTTFSNQSASSSAANRIITSTGSDLVVGAGGSVTMIYDSGNVRWRVISYTNAA